MVNLTIAGGLGNQMFQYAYARAISEAFNDPEIVINTYFNSFYRIYQKMIKAIPQYLDYQLNLFKLNPNVREMSAIKGMPKGFCEMVYGTFIRLGAYDPKITDEKYKKNTYKGNFRNFSEEYTYHEHSHECKSKNKSVLGWYQSEKYFSKIRPILLEEFQFKLPPSDKNQEMIDELSSCNSVCVHVRRGDFTNPHYSYFSMCGEGYYREGMKYIAERTDNPVFYIFTNNHDDVEWLKQNYDFGFPVKYVDLGNSGYDDMRLMYACKHFVISRSTFSWWGSYMSQSENKIVVAPGLKMEECWLKDKTNNDFFRDEMIKLDIKEDGV